jgi:hypothetical protein
VAAFPHGGIVTVLLCTVNGYVMREVKDVRLRYVYAAGLLFGFADDFEAGWLDPFAGGRVFLGA